MNQLLFMRVVKPELKADLSDEIGDLLQVGLVPCMGNVDKKDL